MAYQFTKGPVSTGKTIREIGAVVNEVGQERRFMGILRAWAQARSAPVSMALLLLSPVTIPLLPLGPCRLACGLALGAFSDQLDEYDSEPGIPSHFRRLRRAGKPIS